MRDADADVRMQGWALHREANDGGVEMRWRFFSVTTRSLEPQGADLLKEPVVEKNAWSTLTYNPPCVRVIIQSMPASGATALSVRR